MILWNEPMPEAKMEAWSLVISGFLFLRVKSFRWLWAWDLGKDIDGMVTIADLIQVIVRLTWGWNFTVDDSSLWVWSTKPHLVSHLCVFGSAVLHCWNHRQTERGMIERRWWRKGWFLCCWNRERRWHCSDLERRKNHWIFGAHGGNWILEL